MEGALQFQEKVLGLCLSAATPRGHDLPWVPSTFRVSTSAGVKLPSWAKPVESRPLLFRPPFSVVTAGHSSGAPAHPSPHPWGSCAADPNPAAPCIKLQHVIKANAGSIFLALMMNSGTGTHPNGPVILLELLCEKGQSFSWQNCELWRTWSLAGDHLFPVGEEASRGGDQLRGNWRAVGIPLTPSGLQPQPCLRTHTRSYLNPKLPEP